MEILQGKIEKMLKLQRSLEMLAHREMEKPDFSFAQECSNDSGLKPKFFLNVFSNKGRNGCPSLYSASPFIEEERTISDALVATVHTHCYIIFHMATVDIILLK